MGAHSRSVCGSHRSRFWVHVGVAGAIVLAGCSTSGSLRSGEPDDGVPTVVAAAETEPVKRFGDAADDPAILVAGNGGVWIAGTDKQFGLRVYDLDGQQLHALDTGRLNNVDAVPVGQSQFLLAASNRTTLTIDLYRADIASNAVQLVGAIALEFEEPYGLCMTAADGNTNVFVGDKTGRVQHWSIDASYHGKQITEFAFASQTEGCVADIDTSTLYVGEEERGIWAVDIASGEMELIDEIGAGRLTADVEGLDIYDNDGRKLLIASSQGDNSFVIYDLTDDNPLLRFRIADHPGKRLDGVSETDGIAVTSIALPGFERGVLVVQDGQNTRPWARQNFKVVDWHEIDNLLQNLP